MPGRFLATARPQANSSSGIDQPFGANAGVQVNRLKDEWSRGQRVLGALAQVGDRSNSGTLEKGICPGTAIAS
jgi:hypothetical protein